MLGVYEGEPRGPDHGGRVDRAYDVHHRGAGHQQGDGRLLLVVSRNGDALRGRLEERSRVEQHPGEAPVVARRVVRLDHPGDVDVQPLLDPQVGRQLHPVTWPQHEPLRGLNAYHGFDDVRTGRSRGPRVVHAARHKLGVPVQVRDVLHESPGHALSRASLGGQGLIGQPHEGVRAPDVGLVALVRVGGPGVERVDHRLLGAVYGRLLQQQGGREDVDPQAALAGDAGNGLLERKLFEGVEVQGRQGRQGRGGYHPDHRACQDLPILDEALGDQAGHGELLHIFRPGGSDSRV